MLANSLPKELIRNYQSQYFREIGHINDALTSLMSGWNGFVSGNPTSSNVILAVWQVLVNGLT